jgi:hypothetical protein
LTHHTDFDNNMATAEQEGGNIGMSRKPTFLGSMIRSGWLHKSDPKGRHWKHRWFELKGGSLSYFTKEQASSKKGELRLVGRSVQRYRGSKYAFAFEITAVAAAAAADGGATSTTPMP